MNRIVIFILLLPALALASDPVISYEDALGLALEQDFGIRLARESAEAARIQAGQAKSGFLPRLDLSGSLQHVAATEESNSAGSLGDTNIDSRGVGLSLSWTLFDGFKMFVDRARYRELGELGEVQARALIEGRVSALHASYFDLVQKTMLIDVARESERLSEDRLSRERRRQNLGAISSADLLSAETALNIDRSAVLQQEIALESSRRKLALMLGLSPDDFSVVSNIDLPPLDADFGELLGSAEASNSAMATAEIDLGLAELGLSGARADWWPSLAFSAGYQWSDRTLGGDAAVLPVDIETESRDLTLGLGLSYNLFNGDRKRLAVQSAKVSLRKAEITREEAGTTLRSDLEEALRTWERREELMRLEASNVVAAETRHRLEEDRYLSGASTSLEYRDAQLALARARSSEISARYLARIARVEIDRLAGRLLAD
jgi:outer membrane protein TolC